jgi:ABC-2 type transport system ATP-binding protein
MDDIEQLCPRMMIIDHGRKLYDGSVVAIREQFGGNRTLIASLEPSSFSALPRDEQGQVHLADLPQGVTQERVEGPRVWLSFGKDKTPAHELVAWLGARYSLRDVTFQEPEIEDVIRRIYEEKLLLPEKSYL